MTYRFMDLRKIRKNEKMPIMLAINRIFISMWNPISIDKYVKIHLKKNPDENEKVLRVRIEAALDDYKNVDPDREELLRKLYGFVSPFLLLSRSIIMQMVIKV
jgi:hypothetical protein